MSASPPDLVDYAMPSLGADMDEGTVIEWLVGVGDRFERGQIVARIETEKSDIDIEIWHPGTVAELVAEPNQTVPVGATLMRFRAETGTQPNQPPSSAPERETPVPGRREPDIVAVAQELPERSSVVSADVPAPAVLARRGSRVWATPLARRLAGERGVELADVVGTGPEGAVRSGDLPTASAPAPEAAAVRDAAPSPTAPASTPAPTSPTSSAGAVDRSGRMRSIIASRMARSNREIPHYRLERDIDLGRLTEYLSAANAEREMSERIVPAAAFVRAVAIAAARHRELNGTWADDQFHPGQGVNVSVAISLRSGGLVTPTIRDADTTSLAETMTLLREFTTAARSGTMRSEWTSAPSSITVTNLGERGADLVHGLISPPEVALVGFGRIVERPVVVGGVVVARPVVTSTLGADHRATDGAIGSRFLSTLANTLEDPACL